MILCVVGPTGVGKTKLSIALAKKYNAIIINADAMQVYKGMNIGTAKVTEEEKEGIPHYLFDICDVTKNYTVYDYQRDARKVINDNKDKNIILVGGSGLYLKAALYNYVFDIDAEITNNYDDLTNEELYEMALAKDGNMQIHVNNRKRLIRFLNKKNIVSEECYPLYDAIYIGLSADREELYRRIDNRVCKMFQNGLVEEVESFYKQNIHSKALSTAIGYKELYRYFNGEISLEDAQELIKKNSRHYAKRQYTWNNNQLDITWFMVDFDNFDKTISNVIEYIDSVNK